MPMPGGPIDVLGYLRRAESATRMGLARFNMRNKRVLVYGGTRLDKQVSTFVIEQACQLLGNESIRLMTGGFERSALTGNDEMSTDHAALEGARRFARGAPLDEYFETWLPDPTKDRAAEQVERFRAGKTEEMRGLSAQARRMKLVQLADAIVTVSGHIQTSLVLELALSMARPALPLSFTGGDSADHWRDNHSYYVARLGLSDGETRLLDAFDLKTAEAAAMQACIAAIATTISRVISRTCLVLMPFQKELDPQYEKLTAVIRAEGYHPIRLDRDLYAGDVRETVVRLLRDCDAVVADVSTRSPNVMYEVGLAHAFGRKPLLLWRERADALEELPFYLRPQRIATGSESALAEALKTYLAEARSGR